MTRDEALNAIWRYTHKDYRGMIDGERTILTLRQGGTTLVCLKDLTDEEIARKLPRAKS